jgi:hypothetical protein
MCRTSLGEEPYNKPYINSIIKCDDILPVYLVLVISGPLTLFYMFYMSEKLHNELLILMTRLKNQWSRIDWLLHLLSKFPQFNKAVLHPKDLKLL